MTKNNNRSYDKIITGLFCFFIIGIINSLPTQAAQETSRLTLSAQGVINVEPDTAHVNTGVETSAKSAQEAVDQNSEIMDKIINTLVSDGISKKDIQTTNFSVQPQYESYKSSSAKNRSPQIIAYRVINSVQIKIKKLKKLGTILDKLVNTGSNRINSISFSHSKAEQYLDQARQKAVYKAKARAKLYAKASRVRLGRILSISEGRSIAPSAPVVRSRSFSRAESSVPIQAGSQSLKIYVTMSWAIRRK